MARGINKAIIVGSLGQNPEIKYSASGSSIVNLSVATNEKWKDKSTGQDVEKTEWHRIVIFGKLAEIAARYLKKGAQVYFEGKIQTRKWQDQSGQDRYITEIIANEMQMLGGRSNTTAQDQSAARDYQAASNGSGSYSAPPADDGFDDIPF